MDAELFRLIHIVQMTGDIHAGKQLVYMLAGREISIKALHLEYGIPYHLLWDRVRGADLGTTYDQIFRIIGLLDTSIPGSQWVFNKESLITITQIDMHYSATIEDTSGKYKFLYIDDPIKKLRKLYEIDPRVKDASLVAFSVSQKIGEQDA